MADVIRLPEQRRMHITTPPTVSQQLGAVSDDLDELICRPNADLIEALGVQLHAIAARVRREGRTA